MLKSLFEISVLLTLVFGLNLSAKAQEDCFYGFRIYVRDEAGRPIGNAKHKVSALSDKDELPPNVGLFKMDEVYMIAGVWGSTVKGDFLLRVSADGFETYERTLNFPVCEFQSYELKLRPKRSTARAHYERLAIRSGRVLEEGGAPFRGANIRATNADGRIYQTKSGENGYFILDLPIGVNRILITDPAITDVVFESYQVETYYAEFNVTVRLKSK